MVSAAASPNHQSAASASACLTIVTGTLHACSTACETEPSSALRSARLPRGACRKGCMAGFFKPHSPLSDGQLCARHPQIRQRKQRAQLRGVLLHPALAAGVLGRTRRGDQRGIHLATIEALANGEPVGLQHQFPGVHGRTRPSCSLDAVEQLTQRDRPDFIEVQLPEQAGPGCGSRSNSAALLDLRPGRGRWWLTPTRSSPAACSTRRRPPG